MIELTPRPAPGLDLIGEYAGSGYKEPHYVARRSDGQVLQLTELLFLVADEIDGGRTLEQVAAAVSERYGKTVTADNVAALIEKLVPLGVVAAPDGQEQKLERADPMLALKFRTRVVPEWMVRALTFVFQPLYWAPIVLAVIGGLIAMDVYVFAVHGVAQGVREMLYSPGLMLAGFGLLLLSAMFHECGHATACRYGGARPGVMGMGIYIVWPALYTDVTDAYRLSRAGRLRTDLGGLYFNSIFMLVTLGFYFSTHAEWLLVVILAQHVEMVHQLLPFLRLDGYYIVADLSGVPDMFARIKPVLASFVPWKKSDQRVTELRWRARIAVTLWVLLVVPVLLFIFTNIVIAAPRIVATAWGSFFDLYRKADAAFGAGRTAAGAFSVFQMLFLGLPIVGIGFTLARMAARTGKGALRWSDENSIKRVLVYAAAVGAIGLVAYVWLPNGDYAPLRPGEKGTVGDAVAAIGSVRGGRPGIDYVTRSGSTTGLTPADLLEGTSHAPAARAPALAEAPGGGGMGGYAAGDPTMSGHGRSGRMATRGAGATSSPSNSPDPARSPSARGTSSSPQSSPSASSSDSPSPSGSPSSSPSQSPPSSPSQSPSASPSQSP